MPNRSELLSRRQAIGLLAGVGAGVVAAACAGSSSSKGASTTTTRSSSVGSSGSSATRAACVLTPEVTEGPYYLDIDKVRSDITEGKEGAPLDLKITVVDASGCTPIRDAAVDVWHCDAGGVYSGFSQASSGGPGGPGGGSGGSQAATDDQTFLRGTQLTDASGLGEFHTIYPGWYRGRAVHIHMKVHVGGSVVHTGQLFFDDGLTDQVYRSAPYNARSARDVRNSADSIYRDAGAASAVLTMTPSGNGYVGEITVGVKRT
ncbi:MAG TPA: intradiol ring-cleavage dioxygenase [Acidimicrobiia bacterium]|nr:intradiol ring-cleavage dioxygenase [Acidimicrobiia bacterium]